MVTLLIPTVTVPRNTQDHTARTEVQLHTARQQVVQEAFVEMVVSYLQPVNVFVGMEEHVIVHPHRLTVTVPVGTQDPTARKKVTRAHNSNINACAHGSS